MRTRKVFLLALTGFNETAAIFSGGRGTFELDLDTSASAARYTLTYSGLSSPVTQASYPFQQTACGWRNNCLALPKRDKSGPGRNPDLSRG
jgi:hypothetical protein